MQIERDENGDFVVPPEQLARRFGLSLDDLRLNIRRGLVRSRVETGQAEDAGTVRITVRIGNRVWLAIFDTEGQMLSENGPTTAKTTGRTTLRA